MSAPWARHYDPGVPLEVEVPRATVTGLLLEAARRIPASPALVFFGKKTSYGDLLDQVRRLARSFLDLGLGPGERLALLLPNCPQLAVSYHAILSVGGVAVPLNPLLSPEEIVFQLKDSGCRKLVVLDHLLPKVEDAALKVGLDRIMVTSLSEALPWPLSWLYPCKARRQGLPIGFQSGPGRQRWRDLLRGKPLDDLPSINPLNLAVLQYTGGTTGTPKAAMLSHKNLLANVVQINAWLPRLKYGKERVVGLIPFFHSFGLTACLNWPLSQGAEILIQPKFDLRTFLSMLRKHRPTVLPGVPTLFIALINHPDLGSIDFSQLWACISGSAPLPQEVRDRFEEITGCRIMEGYGLTEAGPVTHLNPYLRERPPGSIGLPFPSTLAKIVDADTGDRELFFGEVGELVVQGPQVMSGYWQRPGETAQVLRDGWLFTGDLARMDENGYFYIIDRKKDLIIDGGFKIYPREVEEVLYQHPKVLEAVAYGIPDPYRGEVTKVAIVPQPGVQLTAEEILAYCQPRLATYKLPKIIEFRTELPKSMVGKVLRRLLREAETGASTPER
uniref:Long-chain fatty acid--CoA ligase n=1 Tax=Desulfobacca acetoxidans TaxID=60893 RepID=A0A7V6DNG7_9BACT